MKLKRVATLFMIFAVVTAGFAGGASAETTTLAGDGSDQVTGFEANESNDIETSIEADGTDFTTDGTETLHMNVSYDGETYAVTSEDVDTGSDSSQTINVSNDELSDLPGDAGANTTVEVTTWGEDADGNVSTPETSFDTDITFSNEYALALVTDDTAESEEIEASTLSSFSMGYFGQSEADLFTYENSVGIDGDNTTVTVLDQSEGTEEVDDRLEDAEDGDLIKSVAVGDGDAPIPAFYGEVDEDRVDVDEDTYAVYHEDGEWTFHLGEDYEDETEFDFVIETQSYADSDYDKAAMSEVFIDSLEVNALGEFGWMDAFNTFGFDAFSTFTLSDLNPL